MDASEGALIAARTLTGAAFLLVGLRNVENHASIKELIASKKAPFPGAVAAVGIGMQIVFGGLMATAYYPAVAALGLLVFVVLATLLAHDFWAKEGEARKADESAFLVNVAIAGGLLALASAAL
jgi:putative oxidoreductase